MPYARNMFPDDFLSCDFSYFSTLLRFIPFISVAAFCIYDNLHIQYTYLITLCNSCSFMCYFNFFNKSGNSLNSKMR